MPTAGRTFTIKQVAEQTGLAPATIRMWEQRYGFPSPSRTASGHRAYAAGEVEGLRRVVALRARGLSLAAAIARAGASTSASDHPSIYATVAAADPGARAQVLRKSTLVAMSRAIEHEAIARAAAPVLFGAFQHERFYRVVEDRYRRLSAQADAAAVFADFATVRHPDGGPVELPIGPDDKLGNEWAVIVDAPGFAACLLAWEVPEGGDDDAGRQFESIWTLDPRATRSATLTAAKLAARADAELGRRLDTVLDARPLSLEEPAPGLTALTNRMVAYLEAAGTA